MTPDERQKKLHAQIHEAMNRAEELERHITRQNKTDTFSIAIHKETDQLRAEADAAITRMMKKRRQADSRAAVWTIVMVALSLLAVLGMSALIHATNQELITTNPEMSTILSVVTFSH